MTKLEHNWRQKTLENLEKYFWSTPNFDSHVVRRTSELRKVQLSNYSIEDLRLMIGQGFGLDYLVPLALEKLAKNLFAEGEFYEGDLLQSVLSIETEFWLMNRNYWNELNELIKNKRTEISESHIELDIFDSYK
jgi:hypothetical protein